MPLRSSESLGFNSTTRYGFPTAPVWRNVVDIAAIVRWGVDVIRATVNCAIASPSQRMRSKGPKFAISSTTFPAQVEWIVGAVRWTTIPARAFVLFPSTKQIRSAFSGVPTTSAVGHSTNPYGWTIT